MKTGFSNRMKDVFTFVREEVIRLGHSSIKVEHLFLGILRDGGGSAIKVLKNLDVEPGDLKTIIEKESLSSVAKLEMDLLPVIFEMIKKGVRVDIERANRFKKTFKNFVSNFFSINFSF